MDEDDVARHLLMRENQIMARLCAFLRIPSAKTDPAFEGGMRQARNFLLRWLESMGLSDVELLDGGGRPAVYGAWEGAPSKPTILVYDHYDVMPPDPVEAWVTLAFESTLETIEGFLKVRGACPVNAKVFLEGEEESGSASLRKIVDRYHPLLQADALISADGGRASNDIPTINFGCRGPDELKFSIKTAAKDLHSGRCCGAVRNTAHEMARTIATLHDDSGAIAVPELIAGVPEPTSDAREQAARFPFDEAEFTREVAGHAHGELGYTARELLTLRPAIDINGVWSGYTGTGIKTIIPNVAHAKLSLRTVLGQRVEKAVAALKAHLQSVIPKGIDLMIDDPGTEAEAFSLPSDPPLVVAARKVLRKTTGRDPILVRLGATVPITVIFEELLGVQTLMFGFNLPDEDVHATNEFFHLTSPAQGLSAWSLLLRTLGEFDCRSFHQGKRATAEDGGAQLNRSLAGACRETIPVMQEIQCRATAQKFSVPGCAGKLREPS
ncbi:M20/M25/M40 family metallo-hydrolase [Bradyrhizobium centrolobii]|uniref:M20/M25/M40 family metallo-hydrolase n=1 Tax=Bradyrhizobium centrolobii TaxID=1505087 RepID=UPI0007C4D7C1|nr:M20/M25/M40 family metallo-hydrolase [Bradyrhizobium centrolobii]